MDVSEDKQVLTASMAVYLYKTVLVASMRLCTDFNI